MKAIIKWSALSFGMSLVWGIIAWLAPAGIAWTVGLLLFVATVMCVIITIAHIVKWGRDGDLWG